MQWGASLDARVLVLLEELVELGADEVDRVLLHEDVRVIEVGDDEAAAVAALLVVQPEQELHDRDVALDQDARLAGHHACRGDGGLAWEEGSCRGKAAASYVAPRTLARRTPCAVQCSVVCWWERSRQAGMPMPAICQQAGRAHETKKKQSVLLQYELSFSRAKIGAKK